MFYGAAFLAQMLLFAALIFVGYVVHYNSDSIRRYVVCLLIYVVIPIVFFETLATLDISHAVFLFPLIFYLCSVLMTALFFYISKFFWTDTTGNILGFAAGQPNAGFFGLPVALVLLDQDTMPFYILGYLALTIAQFTVAVPLVAKGKETIREGIFRTLRLPILYAMLAGLLFNIVGVSLPSGFEIVVVTSEKALTYLGMMTVGMALPRLKLSQLDMKFLSLSFLAQFVIWPLVILLLIHVDQNLTHLYDSSIYKPMILLSLMPIAANTVTWAIKYHVQPQKAAIATLSSTIFSMVYIPIVVSFL